MLPLPTATLARLEAASRTLLSPLAFDDTDGWRDAVMAATCEAFGARTAMFDLPGQPVYARVFRMDGRVEEGADYYLRAVWTGTGTSPDPVLTAFHERIVRERIEVWDVPSTMHMMGVDPAGAANGWTGDILLPNRMQDGQCLFVHTTAGSVHLSLHDLMQTPAPGELLPALGLLLPSFKAGLDALDRLRAHRSALDDLDEPLALFDADGVETHRTPALRGLLAAEPEAGRLDVALAAFARQLRPLAFARRADAPGVRTTTAEVRTARAAYALRAVLLAPGALGHGDAYLVSVAAQGALAMLPTADDVRARHGLSTREAEVALLVAQGLSNDQIADRLFVSRHTVRHHVEAAMAKLDLTGRGREAIAPRLLGAEVA